MVILDRRPLPVRLLDDLEADGPRLLAPLGWLYGRSSSLWRRLRTPKLLKAPPPSIGVGNLRVGGTGKTPVVADLAQAFGQRGLRVAVLTRGYRSEGGGDEPEWLQGQGPLELIRDADRLRGFEAARQRGVDLVLLDDALQGRAIPTRHLAIVLDRDLENPPRILPAGPAREGPAALKRAWGLLVRVQGAPWPPRPEQMERFAAQARRLCKGPCWAFRLCPRDLIGSETEEPLELAQASSLGRVILVSGLARPQSFEADAVGAGIDAVASMRLSDHARPDSACAAELATLARTHSAEALVCPEKNRLRLAQLQLPLPLHALRSRIEWAPHAPHAELVEGLAF